MTHKLTTRLQLKGLGYSANLFTDESKNITILKLKLGYCHPKYVIIEKHVEVFILSEKKITTLLLRSTNKAKLTQLTSQIKKLKKPSRYTGKGIIVIINT